MSMDWFRSWHGAPTDPKWLVVAKRAKVAPGMVSAVAWALFDYASQNTDRGSVDGFDVETYATFTGWEDEQIEAVIDAMRSKGIITTDDRLSSWDKRQPKREDPSSTDRVRKWREAQRNAPVTRDSDVTDGETQRNAVKQNVTTDKIREDKDKIREDENREDIAPAATPPAKQRTVTAGSQQDMFGAIAETCQLDETLKRGQIAKQSKALLEAGYTPAQVRAFPGWWQSNDWRGQRGNVPTLAQLAELIKQSTQNKEQHTNGKFYTGIRRDPKDPGSREPTAAERAEFERAMAAIGQAASA